MFMHRLLLSCIACLFREPRHLVFLCSVTLDNARTCVPFMQRCYAKEPIQNSPLLFIKPAGAGTSTACSPRAASFLSAGRARRGRTPAVLTYSFSMPGPRATFYARRTSARRPRTCHRFKLDERWSGPLEGQKRQQEEHLFARLSTGSPAFSRSRQSSKSDKVNPCLLTAGTSP